MPHQHLNHIDGMIDTQPQDDSVLNTQLVIIQKSGIER